MIVLPHFAQSMLETPNAFVPRDSLGSDLAKANAAALLADFVVMNRFSSDEAALKVANARLPIRTVLIDVDGDHTVTWNTKGDTSIAEVCLMITCLDTLLGIVSLNAPEDDHRYCGEITLPDDTRLTTDLSDPSLLTAETVASYGYVNDVSFALSEDVTGWQDKHLWGQDTSAYAENVRMEHGVLRFDMHSH